MHWWHLDVPLTLSTKVSPHHDIIIAIINSLIPISKMFLRKVCEDFFFHHTNSKKQFSLQSEKMNIYHLMGRISSSNIKVFNPTLMSTGWQRNFGHWQDHSNIQANSSQKNRRYIARCTPTGTQRHLALSSALQNILDTYWIKYKEHGTTDSFS